LIEFFAFAFYPAYPAACDHAYPVPVLSLMRMGYTTGFTSLHRIRAFAAHPYKSPMVHLTTPLILRALFFIINKI